MEFKNNLDEFLDSNLTTSLKDEWEKKQQWAKWKSSTNHISKPIDILSFMLPSNLIFEKENLNYSKVYSPSKQVVVKQISNLKLNHFKNALSYAIENMKQDESKESLHLENALSYAMRDGYGMIDSFKRKINSADEVLAKWEKDIKSSRENANIAWHLVFSIDEKITDENCNILKNSAYDALSYSLNGEYDFVLCIHSHQNKPHCHVILNKTSRFTGKKLHFKSKNEIKNYFFNLREEFKRALFKHSRGEMKYENLNPMQTDLYYENIKKLENLKQSTPPPSFNFNEYIDLANFDLLRKEKALKENNKALSSKAKTLCHELEKIRKNRKEIYSIEDALNIVDITKLDNFKALEKIMKQIKTNKTKLKQISKTKEKIKDFNSFMSTRLKDMQIIQQKESILKYLSTIPLSKRLSNKLLSLKKEVKEISKSFESENENITNAFSFTLKLLNSKSNLFVITKMIENLNLYKNSFILSDLDASKKDLALKEIDSNVGRLENLLHKRLEFLLKSLDSALEKKDILKKEYENRFFKNLSFMIKEINTAINYLSNTSLSRFNSLVNEYNEFSENIAKENREINESPNLSKSKIQKLNSKNRFHILSSIN